MNKLIEALENIVSHQEHLGYHNSFVLLRAKKALQEHAANKYNVYQAFEDLIIHALENDLHGEIVDNAKAALQEHAVNKEERVSQDELMIELADKRLCMFSNLEPIIYSLSLKHTAEHLLDKYSITRLSTPPTE